jgi:general L-amino acid transport system substrate-binding protein
VAFAQLDEALKAYDSGRCDSFTADASALYSVRLKLAKPEDHVVLPEIISKEPLSPFVRHGDEQWFDIVKWVHFALLNAEEYNITKANVDEQMKSDNPEIKRLLGTEGNFGEQLGLSKDWVYRIVKHVGNYGEIFERNLGQGSPLKISRGLNGLWTKGGIQIGPPVR